MILDDVWPRGERILEQLTRFRDSENIKCIISRRDHGVPRRMVANHMIHVEPLRYEQSWETFVLY